MPKQTDKPKLYRYELFIQAKRRFYRPELRFDDIATRTGLASNTVQAAFKGRAAKLETLKILADFFEIDWLSLFDVEKRLEATEPAAWSVRDGAVEL